MTFDIDRAALDEIASTVAHYETEREGLAAELLDELEAAKARIATMPQRFPFYPGTSVQRELFKRFPYFVAFERRDDVIRILAVGHQHREPHYWAKRT